MFGVRHESRPPQTKELFLVLYRHQVSYVLGGSVAAAFWGAEIDSPGDLDVIPELTRDNLGRLAVALAEMEARPHGPFGYWTASGDGEFKWLSRPTTEEELELWRPNVEEISSFDHLYTTKYGNFDVVPEIAGTFELLNPRAKTHEIGSVEVRVVHIDDLLARLTVLGRGKDIERASSLRSLQRHTENDSS